MERFDTSLWRAAIAKKNLQRETYRKRKLAELRDQLTRYFAPKKVARVYLIGSILRPEAFNEDSDIDIVVRGLSEDYFRVSAELEGLVGRSLDLIEMERCRFTEYVESEGLRII